MAYVVSVKATSNAASGTGSWSAPLLTNQENDLVLIFASHRNTASTLSITGYTGLGTQQSNDAVVSRWFVKKVGASPETSYTVSCTGTAQGSSIAYVVRDADVSGTAANAIDGVATPTVGSTGQTVASPTLTTSTNNCLILHAVAWDGSTAIVTPPLAGCNILAGVTQAASGSWFKGTAGAIDTFTWTGSTSTNAGTAHAIAIKNGSGGDNPIRVTDNRKFLNLVGGFSTLTTAAPNANPPNVATINAVNTGTAVATVGTAMPTIVPWINNGIGITSTENLASPAWVGAWVNCTSANILGKPLVCPYGFSTTVDSARVGQYGIIICFADASNNWEAHQLMPQIDMTPGNASFKTIKPGTTTAFASSVTEAGSTGNAVDYTAITKVGYFYHRQNGTAASVAMYWHMPIYEDSVCVVFGGGSENYISTAKESTYLLGGRTYIGTNTFQGAGQLVNNFGIQYGNGTDATYVKHEAQTYGVPSSSDSTWGVGTSGANVTIYGSASDTFDFSASSFANDQKQTFTIHASSSTSAIYNFVGCSFVGWDVTWKTGVTCTGATFSQCGEINFKGADVTSCTIKNTASTDAAAAWDTSGATVDSCSIDGTGALYGIELGTSVTSITLTDCTITAGSTDKVHVKATTGTVTITISGTTILAAGDVTTDGATVVIAAPQPTLSATVLASSRVVLYNNTTDAELDNTAPAGTSWSKVITSGASVNDSLTLHVFKEGYEEFSTSFLYTGDDQAILVTQAADANIASLRTELGITDYTTITEFALDTTGTVEIDADDADGSTTKARLAIWYNGVLTTENGARYLRGAITILSTAAFRINTSVLDLKIENISATFGLNFTDTERRLYRDDGAPIYAAASAPGSIQNDYSGVPDTVETGVSGLTGSESAQLMALPSASTIASTVLTSAQSTPIYADARKMNGATITGTGVDSDLWRGA